MRLHEFDSYEQYLETQIRGSNWRSSRRANVQEVQVSRMVEYLMKNKPRRSFPSNGICHGARCGTEVEYFRKYLPGTYLIGTDVAPRLNEHVIEWDFQQQKPEWVGHFDFIFSNCVDHASDPLKCISVWLEQLTKDGYLFVQWEMARWLLDKKGNEPWPRKGGDCFGASLDEYVKMLDGVGVVRDLIYCKHTKWGMGIVIVVQRRQ